MKKRYRTYNTVRTDTLEGKIALYQAQGDHRTADAFIKLAKDIGAPVRQEEIDNLKRMYRAWGYKPSASPAKESEA